MTQIKTRTQIELEKKIEIENVYIKSHLEYVYPEIMDEKPELLGRIVNDFYDGVPTKTGYSIKYLNGMNPHIYPYEEFMLYIEDRLMDERWFLNKYELGN